MSGITLFEWWKQKLSSEDTDFIALHSATRKDIFVEGYGKYKKYFPTFTFIPFEKFLKKLEKIKGGQYVGEVLGEQEESLKKMGLKSLETSDENIPAFLQERLKEKIKKGKYVEPFYGRMGQVK